MTGWATTNHPDVKASDDLAAHFAAQRDESEQDLLRSVYNERQIASQNEIKRRLNKIIDTDRKNNQNRVSIDEDDSIVLSDGQHSGQAEDEVAKQRLQLKSQTALGESSGQLRNKDTLQLASG